MFIYVFNNKKLYKVNTEDLIFFEEIKIKDKIYYLTNGLFVTGIYELYSKSTGMTVFGGGTFASMNSYIHSVRIGNTAINEGQNKIPSMFTIHKYIPNTLNQQINWLFHNISDNCRIYSIVANLIECYGIPNDNYYLSWAIDDPKKISYISRDRLDRFNHFDNNVGYDVRHDVYNHELRQKYAYMGKVGKVLKKLFPDIENSKIETITHQLRPQDITFKVVEGKDITHWYNGDNYAEGEGTLNSSCMRGSDCSDYFEVYEDNIKMIVALNEDNELCGRALLWEGVRFDNLDRTITFMDRIYYNQEYIKYKFISYAIDNGYIYKEKQSYEYKKTFIFKGETIEDTIYYDLKHDMDTYDYAPYIDTFTYSDDGGTLTNEVSDYEYTSTEGGNNQNMVYSSYEGERIPTEQAVYIDSINDYVHEEHTIYDSYDEESILCDDAVQLENYEWTHKDNAIEVDNKWYHKNSDKIVCDGNGDYILLDDACLVESEQEYYHSDNCVFCEEEGVYELVDSAYCDDETGDYYTIKEKYLEYNPKEEEKTNE